MADPRDLSPATVCEGLKANEIMLVDVREPNEFAFERIHGALLHPLSTFEPKAIPTAPGRKIVFQCGSGKRSRAALRVSGHRTDPRGDCARGVSASSPGAVLPWP